MPHASLPGATSSDVHLPATHRLGRAPTSKSGVPMDRGGEPCEEGIRNATIRHFCSKRASGAGDAIMRDFREHRSTGSVESECSNGDPLGHSSSGDDHTLLRQLDDFLLITTNKDKAIKFVNVMHDRRRTEQFGFNVHEAKVTRRATYYGKREQMLRDISLLIECMPAGYEQLYKYHDAALSANILHYMHARCLPPFIAPPKPALFRPTAVQWLHNLGWTQDNGEF